MNMTNLEFSFDMTEIDRQSILAQAADQVDWLAGHLGDTDISPQETPNGQLLRELRDADIAKFAGYPTLYKITENDFLKHGRQIPVCFEQLAQRYNFYWLYLPITLFPARCWPFNRLEVAVEFNPGILAAYTRPTAYQILPQKQFQELLQVSNKLEVRIGEDFEFVASTILPPIQTGSLKLGINPSVNVKLASEVGFVIGPFEYHLKKARIDHTAPGLEKVFWRLDGAEFFEDDDAPLIVIVQVPTETKELQIIAAMQAYRYFNLASAGLRESLANLPKAIRDFFTGGIPLRDEKLWNLTPML